MDCQKGGRAALYVPDLKLPLPSLLSTSPAVLALGCPLLCPILPRRKVLRQCRNALADGISLSPLLLGGRQRRGRRS
jgi:hypothetical protein